MLACDLLVAGVSGDVVAALAAESARTLSADDANRRLAPVTTELGLAEPDLATAVDLIAADTCRSSTEASPRRWELTACTWWDMTAVRCPQSRSLIGAGF
ncbi:hypothetical protein [Actinoplanes subglobosus]|uniref:Uncharacterized protein n=1 Tax=Actinoplanes subglobosus TaxID=1547892 RepID=A0ABV8JAA0_9ACTN